MRNLIGVLFRVAGILVALSPGARGQFTTVINVPPQAVPSQLNSNTQVNLYAGGQISSGSPELTFGAADGSITNVELNVLGGNAYRPLSAYTGGRLNFNGGSAYDVFARAGGQVQISDQAFVQLLRALAGGTVQVTGGETGFTEIAVGSTVRVAGGVLRPGVNVTSTTTSPFTLAGGQFAINGVPVAGLVNPGDKVTMPTLPTGSVLTGVLADGTPVILSSLRQDALRRYTLELTALPAAAPQVAAADYPLLRGVRGGQTLVVGDGATARSQFRAGPGSILNVLPSGVVGGNLEAAGATVNVMGGKISSDFVAFSGTVVNLQSGQIENRLIAHPGSIVNISGGQVFSSFSVPGGTLNLSGGSVASSGRVSAGGRVNVTGGSLGDAFQAQSTSTVSISGGKIGRQFSAATGSTIDISGGSIGERLETTGGRINLIGGEFRLNGNLISGLDSVGNTKAMPVEVIATDILSGVFADGTPFVFTRHDLDSLSSSLVTLRAANIAPINPGVIVAATDPVPLGIRSGQTLRINAGAVVGDDYMVGRGAVVDLQTGGSLGSRLEAIGATININGGSLGSSADAFPNTTVNLNSGQIGTSMRIFDHSVLNVAGGSIGTSLRIMQGGQANVSGGSVTSLTLETGSQLSMTGGTVSAFVARTGTTASISGGTFGDGFATNSTSNVTLTGGDFRLNGQPISSLNAVGNSAIVNVLAEDVLTGVLANGSSFAITSHDSDSIATGTLRLTVAALPTPVAQQFIASAGGVPVSIRGQQTLIVDSGATVLQNFAAGPGSKVIVQAGGTMGRNFEALGAEVRVEGGTVSEAMDAYQGSVVNVLTGSVVSGLQVYHSEVNLSGGTIDELDVFNGGKVVVTGGTIGGGWQNTKFGPGSTLNISNGAIGEYLEMSGTEMTISGGQIGERFQALAGSTIVMSGGSFGFNPEFDNSTFRMSSGVMANVMRAENNSVVEISGGQIGENLLVSSGSRLKVTGGIIANEWSIGDGRLDISGGQLGREAQAYHAEVNISGGRIDNSFTASNSVLNISGGTVGEGAYALESSQVVMNRGVVERNFGLSASTMTKTGGTIGESLFIGDGSTANLTGGIVQPGMDIYTASTVNLSGGAVGRDIYADAGTHLVINGGEFRVNGQPVGAVASVAAGAFVTGTLADGTPFAIGTSRDDEFAAGTLSLQQVTLPSVGPPIINAATDPLPKGLRAGQTLNVGTGGVVGNYFRAGWGSVINLSGGSIGHQIEGAGAMINVTGGVIGDDFLALSGSTVNISNAKVGDRFEARAGSQVQITGGRFGAGFAAGSQSVVTIKGGAFGDEFQTNSGSDTTIYGEQFQINGQPIPYMQNAGDTTTPALPYDGTLSGILQDGTPFVFTLAEGDYPLSGLKLRVAFAAPISSQQINAAVDPVPLGVRQGQTLTVGAGSLVGDHFNAGTGSRVIVRQGGAIGANLEAFRANVEIEGGTVGNGMDAFMGAKVTISGGTVGNRVDAYAGSEVVITGGKVGNEFIAKTGSLVSIAGGTVGDEFTAESGSEIRISNGNVGKSFRATNAKVRMTGGRIAREARFESGGEFIMSGGQIGADAAIYPAVVEISGGSVGASARLSGSSVTISGGAFAPGVFITANRATISGGQFGDDLTFEGYDTVITGGRFEDVLSNAFIRVVGGEFVDDLVIVSGKQVGFDGGTVHELQLNPESLASIRGGQQTQINAFHDSKVSVFGWGFSINGVPLNGLSIGQPLPITERDVVLRGTLSDGSPFAYELNTQLQGGEDFFDEKSLLSVVLSTPLGDYNANGIVDAADYVVWRKTGGSQVDYNLWRANLGKTAGVGSDAAANAAVPEPASLLIVAVGVFIAAIVRRSTARP